MLSPVAQGLCTRVMSRSKTMIAQTIALAEQVSGSHNLDGIYHCQSLLGEWFSQQVESTEYRALPNFCEYLADGSVKEHRTAPLQIFTSRPDAPLQLLFTGHSDTVFPVDSSFQQCWLQGDKLHGPGTADMKGGLVVILEALRQLDRSVLASDFGYTVAISPDEEIGSLGSAPELVKLARTHHIGLTYEPALEDGTLAGARKGSGNFTVVAHGLSAHAGRNFFAGRNAIVALAEVVQALANLSDESRGISVNCGVISGGEALNIVPDTASLKFNIRVTTLDQADSLIDQIDHILQDIEAHSGVKLTRYGSYTRPPKPMSPDLERLFKLLQTAGESLGQMIQWRATGGCCEGNNLAAAGLLNIDTLGVRGANIHTEQEYACVSSFTERAALTIAFIDTLISQHKRGGLPC